MTLGEKLVGLRKGKGLTQENLAEILGVSRQAVSRWESDASYPETEKLVKLSELFGCTLDYLIKDSAEGEGREQSFSTGLFHPVVRTSGKMWHGLPLFQVGRRAKGVFAVGIEAEGFVALGIKAKGICSFGVLSLGIFSFGLLALGAVSFGLLVLGLLAFGAIAFGLLSFGAIALGVVSFGALSKGLFSYGALAWGKYFAYGSEAKAMVAIGKEKAVGTLLSHVGSVTGSVMAKASEILLEGRTVPQCLKWIASVVVNSLRLKM